MALSKLIVQLGLDRAQYSSGLTGAAGEARKATGAMQGSFDSMARSLLAIAAPAAVFGAISKFAIEGVKEFVAYNKTVRETSEATGATAEEVSRLIQVGDDWGIQSGEITSAMKMMTKNGLAPTVENLAKLADEFVNTTDKTAFAEKAAKLLGRNWSTLVPILKGGGDALRDQAAAVSEGLLATDESIRKARAYEVAMDNLGDMTTELKYLFADQLLPSIIAVTNATASLGFATLGLSSAAKTGKITWREYLEQSAKVAWTSYSAADAQRWLADKLAEQRGEVTNSIGSFEGLIQRQKDLRMYTDDSAEAQSNLALAIGGVSKAALGKSVLDDLTTSFINGKISAGEFEARALGVMTATQNMTTAEGLAVIELAKLDKAQKDNKLSAEEHAAAIQKVIDKLYAIDGKAFNASLNIDVTQSGGGVVIRGGQITTSGRSVTPVTPYVAPNIQGGQFGGARGLDMIVPSGYPNDSYPVRATSGERLTITPRGGNSGGNVNVTLVYAPAISTMDKYEAEKVLLPFIKSGIREYLARPS